MSFELIYAKTAKGVEEVRARSESISTLARRVLIMIDGRRSENELRWAVRDGQLDSVLAELRSQGLIEECGMAEQPDGDWPLQDDATVPMDPATLRLDLALGSRAAPPTLRDPIDPPARAAAPQSTTIVIRPGRAPATVTAPPAAPAGPSLEDVKRTAVRALFERLGPYGEEPAARIQDCKSLEALREQIKHACKRITTFRGAPAAREYLDAIGLR